MSVYVGIDVHRKRSQVAVVTEDGTVQLNKNTVNGTEPLLRLSGTGLALVHGEGARKATDRDDRLMIGYPLEVDIRPAAPGSAEGRAVLTAYFREVVSRHHKRAATDAEVAAAMRAEPSDDLCPPGGLLLLARHDGRVLGCAGLRLLAAGTGEVTRVFVASETRRRGIGQQLLDAVEDGARHHRVTRLRLDTSDYLTEARRLYIRNGFREVAPFTEGRVANLWYEKSLS